MTQTVTHHQVPRDPSAIRPTLQEVPEGGYLAYAMSDHTGVEAYLRNGQFHLAGAYWAPVPPFTLEQVVQILTTAGTGYVTAQTTDRNTSSWAHVHTITG